MIKYIICVISLILGFKCVSSEKLYNKMWGYLALVVGLYCGLSQYQANNKDSSQNISEMIAHKKNIPKEGNEEEQNDDFDEIEDYSNDEFVEELTFCPMCKGSGIFELSPGCVSPPPRPCEFCEATGQVSKQVAYELVRMQMQIRGISGNGNREIENVKSDNSCYACHGTGKCTVCAGKGWRIAEGTYSGNDFLIACSNCNQTGLCEVCHGRKY